MTTIFEQNLSQQGLNEKQKKDARINNINQIDIGLKQRRDDETGTLSVVEDLNHTLSELGQRGHSYRILNKLAGQQIAMKARSKGDRRRLDLLDHIRTPGGVYGHTVEGMKLKQITVNQMEADSEADEASARATYTHGIKVLLHDYKMEVGQLLKEKAAETDPNKIQEIEKKIQGVLSNAGTEGVGGQLQIYKNRLTTGMDSLTQGKNRTLGLEDTPDTTGLNPRTVRERLLDVIRNPATDASLSSREWGLNTEFDGENITLNPEALNWIKAVTKSYVAPTGTDLWTVEREYQEGIITNNLEPFNMYPNHMAKIKGLGKQQPTPPAILARLAKAKNDLRFAFVQEFDKYGTSLEQRPEDENTKEENRPRYGFGQWIGSERATFVDSADYKEKVRKITDDLDVDLKKLTALEVPKKKERDDHKRRKAELMPAPSKGPGEFQDLQKMIYDDDDGVEQRHYSVVDTYERFKKAIWGLTLNASDDNKKIADIHSWDNDMDSWFSEALAGTDNPKIKQKQIQAMWDWGIYLIKRQKIKNISLDSGLSKEQKEKQINAYRKSKVPFPKDITSFIGSKKEIEKQKLKKQEKPSNKESNKKPEETKEAYKEGVLDLKTLWNNSRDLLDTLF